ncbi:TSUP family transporter [Nostocoides sp. F2B08]|uniref:sulfite exporter TauE/SafE family protein n=1 Tax=Nostocoides sp. F2B08 TaxID=2653936 RepID=UPI001262B708|nr:sulfite exporter TauE/SafE family protein [Tetrasphaera sp. F2B08]KAB7744507.1 TSUP family transporter [Tetrasphaera sp. F2B08]
MSALEAVAILLAGFGAGMINAVVGSGTLITFPTLLWAGYAPVTANVSNTLGLVAGGVAGSWGYRGELVGAGPTLRRLLPMSVIGAAVGAVLVIVLPPGVFEAAVPVLIGVGAFLVVAGPRLQAAMARHRPAADGHGQTPGVALLVGVMLAGMYGGYFGAAQGVILIGLLSLLTTDPLQRINGYKNILATAANVVGALTFLVIAPDRVVWEVVGLIALGSVAGGIVGAAVGRRIPTTPLRIVVLVISVIAIVAFVTR